MGKAERGKEKAPFLTFPLGGKGQEGDRES